MTPGCAACRLLGAHVLLREIVKECKFKDKIKNFKIVTVYYSAVLTRPSEHRSLVTTLVLPQEAGPEPWQMGGWV